MPSNANTEDDERASSKSLYQSVPVDLPNRSIRLLRLFDDPDSDLIDCELDNFSFTSCPPYIALSYRWGDPTPTKQIRVNRHIVVVRNNLWQFLLCRNNDKSQEYYWIDAICIDQSNTNERNHQIGLMKEIYSTATLVNIWLGSTTATSAIGIDFIQGCFYTSWWSLEQKTKEQKIKIWSKTQGEAVRSLMKNQYWRRVWVVQEILLAKDILISCGDKSCTWWNLISLHRGLQDLETKGRISHHPHAEAVLESNAMRLVRAREQYHFQYHFVSPRDELLNLLVTFHDLESTDSRDKVYGLLGLANNTTNGIQSDYSEVLPAGYSKSTVEVFADTLQFLDSCRSLFPINKKSEFVYILGHSLNLVEVVVSNEFKVLKKDCQDEIILLPEHNNCELLLLGALLLRGEVIYRKCSAVSYR